MASPARPTPPAAAGTPAGVVAAQAAVGHAPADVEAARAAVATGAAAVPSLGCGRCRQAPLGCRDCRKRALRHLVSSRGVVASVQALIGRSCLQVLCGRLACYAWCLPAQMECQQPKGASKHACTWLPAWLLFLCSAAWPQNQEGGEEAKSVTGLIGCTECSYKSEGCIKCWKALYEALVSWAGLCLRVLADGCVSA